MRDFFLRRRKLTPGERLQIRAIERDNDPSRLPDSYRYLSQTYTALMPEKAGRNDVGVLVKPGAAKALGCHGYFMPAAARIVLDGDLLPCDPSALDPRNNPEHFDALAVFHGVFIHEAGHAAHTVIFEPPEGYERERIYVDGTPVLGSVAYHCATQLEEIRMEAQVARERPEDVRWLKAAMRKLHADVMTGQLEFSKLLDKLGFKANQNLQVAVAAIYTIGRTYAGVLDEDDVKAFSDKLDQLIDSDTRNRMEEIFAEAVQLSDEEQHKLLFLGERLAALFSPVCDCPCHRRSDERATAKDARGEVGSAAEDEQGAGAAAGESEGAEGASQGPRRGDADEDEQAAFQAGAGGEDSREPGAGEHKSEAAGSASDKAFDGEPTDGAPEPTDEKDGLGPSQGESFDECAPGGSNPAGGAFGPERTSESQAGAGETGSAGSEAGESRQGDSAQAGESAAGEESERGQSHDGSCPRCGCGGEDADGGGLAAGGGLSQEELDGLADAAAEALAQAAREQLEEMGENDPMREEIEQLADEQQVRQKIDQVQRASGGFMPGAPSGARPELGEREPTAREKAARVALSRKLREVRWRERQRVKRSHLLPPGRVRGRELIRQRVDRSRGMPSQAQPWKRQRSVHTEFPAVTCAVLIDTSGSMSGTEDMLASALWVISNAIAENGGRTGGYVFGDAVEPVLSPASPPRYVTTFEADGGTAGVPETLEFAEQDLAWEDAYGPRLLVICSDGMWGDVDETADALSSLKQKGVVVLLVGINNAPVDLGMPELFDDQLLVRDEHELAQVIGRAAVRELANF